MCWVANGLGEGCSGWNCAAGEGLNGLVVLLGKKMRLYNQICCSSRVTMTVILCSDDAGVLERLFREIRDVPPGNSDELPRRSQVAAVASPAGGCSCSGSPGPWVPPAWGSIGAALAAAGSEILLL